MASVATKLITVEEFSKMPDPSDGSKQELVRGEIVTLPPPLFKHGLYQGTIVALLNMFVKPRKLGRVTVESGLVTENDPDTVRGPDVAYWSADRLPLDVLPAGYPDVAADLVVEVLSEAKRALKLKPKLREYFTRGVRAVWVVKPDERTVTIYRSPDEGRVFHETKTLSGEDVLPGFSCAVADLFA